MYVIGTAGHVDHGKSTLVQALTGIDPDRWEEEKRRGLTIDLGFALLRLPSGDEVSVVDVPGHERFIKNMLAGVGGIDLALLVIAADEGVMPQTREHLAIIDLLGIERGVVALTKADLVDPDALELACLAAAEALPGTTLECAPIVACSAISGAGIAELLATLEAELAKAGRKRDIGRPRLPIDRAFTMPGFGTVVTGTLIDGSLSVGQDVEVLPSGTRARVRGLQTHGEKVDLAPPGRRTAVNLSGIAVEDLHRGMVLARPGTFRPTTAVDVRLRAVPYLSRPVRHNLTITFHTGAAGAEGRLLLLDAAEVKPGAEAWAQVRLTEPVVAVAGDHCIIRDPNDTLGGGLIVETDVPRHRRFDAETIAHLETLSGGSLEDLVITALSGAQPTTAADIVAAIGRDLEAVDAAIGRLMASGDVIRLDDWLHSRAEYDTTVARLDELLTTHHERSPLRAGMPREELRTRLGLTAELYDSLLKHLSDAGVVAERAGAVALASHQPAPTPAHQTVADAYLKTLRSSPYSPPTNGRPDDDLLGYLEARGDVVNAGHGVVFAADAYDEMVDRIKERLETNGAVTLGQVRDMFGTTRKYATALLEHLDSTRVTRRVGDDRVLR
ncbi:MAG: selenocysteine-specific translation elongation factor [Dehalococcoidia bacterium]